MDKVYAYLLIELRITMPDDMIRIKSATGTMFAVAYKSLIVNPEGFFLISVSYICIPFCNDVLDVLERIRILPTVFFKQYLQETRQVYYLQRQY